MSGGYQSHPPMVNTIINMLEVNVCHIHMSQQILNGIFSSRLNKNFLWFTQIKIKWALPIMQRSRHQDLPGLPPIEKLRS